MKTSKDSSKLILMKSLPNLMTDTSGRKTVIMTDRTRKMKLQDLLQILQLSKLNLDGLSRLQAL